MLKVFNKNVIAWVLAVVPCTLLSLNAQGESEACMQQLRLAIDVAIGDPRANSVNQCRVIALGAKSCGGPSEYLVYSLEVTEDQTLRDLVGEYTRCEQDRNERLGTMSDCEFVKQPQLTIKDGRCQAN